MVRSAPEGARTRATPHPKTPMSPEPKSRPAPDTPNESAFTDLEMPDMSLRGLLGHFGPGVILMMTGIGTSHLVTAPTAGGRFGYALLWCLPLAYIFKYYGFEMAFRFTNATGKSMIEAYSTAWRKWPLWYVLVTTIIQCALGQAGRLIAAAAVLYYVGTEAMGLPISLTVYGLILAVVSVAIILRGRYKAVEVSAKILAAILVVSTLAVYLAEPAPLAEMGHFFLVEIPEGSWLIIAAFLGLLPTGIDVSLQASEWGKAKKKGMSRIREQLEGLGIAEHPQLRDAYFGNYTRVVHLVQEPDDELETAARHAAASLGLRYERLVCGFGGLATSLQAMRIPVRAA